MYKAYGDGGYGFWKFEDNRGNRVFRQSAYSAMPTGLNGTEIGIESDYGNFLFGKSALEVSAMANRAQSYTDCLSDAYAANVLLSITEMNKGNVVDCELVLSLPFEAMYLQNELIARLTGEHRVRRLGGKWQTINISFPKDEKGNNFWGVMPQNAAPVFASLDLKNIKREGEVWFAVANVGSQTFEQGTFGIDLNAYAIRPGVKAQQASKEKGMYTLANDIEPLLKEFLRGDRTGFSQHEIFETLISETVWVGNEQVDVSEIIRPKKQEYLETVYNYCRQLWRRQNGREILEMYELCVAGGGAHIVAPYLQEMGFHNNIVVSDDPQFDVCIGSRNWHKLIGEK